MRMRLRYFSATTISSLLVDHEAACRILLRPAEAIERLDVVEQVQAERLAVLGDVGEAGVDGLAARSCSVISLPSLSSVPLDARLP